MTVVNLGLLTPEEGFEIKGGATYRSVGINVSPGGDVNGDGIDDMIVGAHGNSYVVYGKEGGGFEPVLQLYFLDPADGAVGVSKANAGDINGDGFDDYVVGVPTHDTGGYDYGYTYAGVTYVTFGGPTPPAGFEIDGVLGDLSGYSVSTAGDINGDGFADIIIGAPGLSSYAGAAYVIFGKASGFGNLDLSSLSATDGFKLSGAATDDYTGAMVSTAGDINGDGFDDYMIGAPRNSDAGQYAGAVYVLFGKESGFSNIDLASLGAADGFTITGEAMLDGAGGKMAAIGDINGDGFADIAIGVIGNDGGGTDAGAVYVILGKESGFGDIDLANLAASDGFKITGESAYDNAGFSVASAGDFNGDGFEDIIIGAPSSDALGTGGGAAYLIYGKAGGFTDIDLSSMTEADGFKIIGDDNGDLAGYAVSSAGDVNNDGYDDLMIGAPGVDNAIFTGVNGDDDGAVYILFGHADVGVVKGGTDAGESITGGNQADTLDGRGGDDFINGLGGADMLIGGSGNDMLDGGAGGDTLIGGAGNDTYVIDSVNDLVVERSAEGTDLVKSSVGYTLGSSLENLTLTGAGAVSGTGNALNNIITGNSGANLIDGKAGADTLSGGAGNDTLAGGDGIDLLNGGTGNDTIDGGNGIDTATYFDAASGVTVKLIAGAQATGAGSDTLVGIENLTGSAFADKLTGDTGANVLTGNDGNDVLSGLSGNDHLNGGAGNDTLDGGGGDDLLAGNAGIDTATYASATAAVTVSLAIATAQTTGFGHDTLSGIENLTGSNFNDTLTGSSTANAIAGGTGNDKIDGGGGLDTLTGGGGADNFVFSSALNGSTNVDKITDFVAVDDTIQLSSAIFAAAGPVGTLSAAAFRVGTAAGDADDRIIYNQSTGYIYYDADGNGAGAKVLFAKVTSGTVLTNADFAVVAASGSSVARSAASFDPIDLHGTALQLHLPAQHDFMHPDRHVRDHMFDARDLYAQWVADRDVSQWFDLRHEDFRPESDFLFG